MKVWFLDGGSIVIEHTQLMWNVPGPQCRIPVYSVLVEHDEPVHLPREPDRAGGQLRERGRAGEAPVVPAVEHQRVRPAGEQRRDCGERRGRRVSSADG